MEYKLIVYPTGKPIRLAGFGSGSGTNLRALIEEEYKLKAISGYSPFEMVFIFTDAPGSGCEHLAREHGIPHNSINIREIYENSGKKISDSSIRRVVYSTLSDRLRDSGVDLIVLGGFMLRVDEPLLTDFRDRIINVHPADLSILDENGQRIYAGGNAVYDALRDGHRQTKSSIHIVNEDYDAGEILVQSKPLEAAGLEDVINNEERLVEFAKRHQEKQKGQCDWPAYITAVKMISCFEFLISDKRHEIDPKCRVIYIDGEPLPYCGYQLGNEQNVELG